MVQIFAPDKNITYARDPACEAAIAAYDVAFGDLASVLNAAAAEVLPTCRLFADNKRSVFPFVDVDGTMLEVGEDGATALCFPMWRADGAPSIDDPSFSTAVGVQALADGTVVSTFKFDMAELADRPTLLNTFRSIISDMEVRSHTATHGQA